MGIVPQLVPSLNDSILSSLLIKSLYTPYEYEWTKRHLVLTTSQTIFVQKDNQDIFILSLTIQEPSYPSSAP